MNSLYGSLNVYYENGLKAELCLWTLSDLSTSRIAKYEYHPGTAQQSLDRTTGLIINTIHKKRLYRILHFCMRFHYLKNASKLETPAFVESIRYKRFITQTSDFSLVDETFSITPTSSFFHSQVHFFDNLHHSMVKLCYKERFRQMT